MNTIQFMGIFDTIQEAEKKLRRKLMNGSIIQVQGKEYAYKDKQWLELGDTIEMVPSESILNDDGSWFIPLSPEEEFRLKARADTINRMISEKATTDELLDATDKLFGHPSTIAYPSLF